MRVKLTRLFPVKDVDGTYRDTKRQEDFALETQNISWSMKNLANPFETVVRMIDGSDLVLDIRHQDFLKYLDKVENGE